ncbi:hypothetical protein [Citrobacter sp. FR21M1BA2611]|uniref:hypothetical protein n=1 Tax=Citrobacter sp. FR21M1BA2611 TaxID=3381295 RepID=UPI003A97DFA8
MKTGLNSPLSNTAPTGKSRWRKEMNYPNHAVSSQTVSLFVLVVRHEQNKK